MPGQAWTQPGAQGIGTDYIGWAADSRYIDLSVNRWYTFDVTELVKLWIASPNSNSGMILLTRPGVSESNQAGSFASREHPDQRLRPMLVVSYWLGG